LEDFPIFTL